MPTTESGAPPKPGYGSAKDLPSYFELQSQIRPMKFLTRLVARDERNTLLDIERQLADIAETVDRFYALLGPRHWIFPDRMNLGRINELTGKAPDQAEQDFIGEYMSGDFLRWEAGRLRRFPQFLDRMDLVQKAQIDYAAGRYYSVVQTLLSVMDGFVNELDRDNRKGLHAREPDEMVAWDSVVGHHMGLAHAHGTYKKGFYKTSTQPVTELYRNGIVHGMLTNFDNVVVATKAWNRLFAVGDWADSQIKEANPKLPKPTWKGLVQSLMELQRDKAALKNWRPKHKHPGDSAFDDDVIVAMTHTYLNGWKSRNFRAMSELISPMALTGSVGQRAGEVRKATDMSLERFDVNGVEYTAPAVAICSVVLTTERGSESARLRWIRGDPSGHGVSPNRLGEWRLMNWNYWSMLSTESSDIPSR